MATGGANYRLFWQEFRRTFESTGAIAPSGPKLCRELARYVAGDGKGRRILEVGPGTGVVTDAIINQMGPADTLDIVELNERFVDALRERLQTQATWNRVADRIRIHHLPIEQLPADEKFEVIVSGLPFNNFPVELVQSILAHLERLAAPGATLSFFEYVAIRRVKSVVCKRPDRERLTGITRTLSDLFNKRQFRQECVLANVPPAWVHHLRYDG
ncbi:class I SAM-dependent methyltransferase [Lacipirellula sp.]|uniref:class I SAM-dependent methyltransferase n=1 Tax=Lacipirellula sp. TaxID=2691419 RepID=UPI003D0C7303